MKNITKPVKTEKRQRPNKVKEVPKIDPVEWTEKLNALEDDVFNFIIFQLGVPKRLEKEDQIDFIINNNRPDRIDNAIINAEKFKP
ncbi:hypothetical protein [uncultured Methanobrevibacter sp.]|uniref:hypothetical protein n=1 Tax=uncultured Methanobrevibacter sp. TaxID=253161 RepID=UPI0025D3A459|nr:hypothetical protein [uncultured Methanobrevibacter sp.]